MKKLLILLLLLAQVGTAQIAITLPNEVATKAYVKAYVDSVLKAGAAKPDVVKPDPVKPDVKPDPIKPEEPVGLKPCDAGPQLLAIKEVTTNWLSAQFHGAGVYGIDWQIVEGTKTVRSGNIKPASSWLPIQYEALVPGRYTLRLSGSTCNGTSTMQFDIPGKPTGEVIDLPTNGAKIGDANQHELFLNMTGYGYDPQDPTGINGGWRERIEAFRYEWGYGITGIRLCVRWYEWEPSQGNYTRQGLQNAIEYCRARGLKLSVFFWPWRLKGDGFIPEGHVVTGNAGGEHSIEWDKRMGSLASDPVNQKIYQAVYELSKQLSTYEGGYYVSLGTAEAEEYINPLINVGREGTQIGGFEPVFQDGFRAFRASKGRTYDLPKVEMWDKGAALKMNTEVGKDFARYISLSLTRYFDNFSKAVHAGGSNKLLACYYYPDAGTIANGWHLNANFASQAASADAMYGTDGIAEWDNQKKLLVNAINLGMGKVSMNEYDAEDLGQHGGYCKGLNYAKIREEFERSYGAGTQVINFAMAFCPDEIRAMEPQIKHLWGKYIGKPYQKPSWPFTVVNIADRFWKGEEIYGPSWNGQNFLIPDDSDFWGKSSRER